jgi:hypothetical protein
MKKEAENKTALAFNPSHLCPFSSSLLHLLSHLFQMHLFAHTLKLPEDTPMLQYVRGSNLYTSIGTENLAGAAILRVQASQ